MAAMKPVWGALMALSVAWAGGSAGELKTFGYGYHAGGTVAAKTYPSGRVVRECADAMGRAVWVSGEGGVNGGTCASGVAVTAGYVTGAQYGAGGGLTEWRLGSAGKGAVAYNSRQQAVRMRWSAGNGGGVGCGASGDEWCIELGYGGGVETSNNGNVTGQKIWAKKGGGGYLQLQQSYGYDGLNRLTTFGETVTAGGSGSGGNWGHTNWYDRWGNRWATGTLPQGMVTPSWAWAIDGGTNRVVTGFNNAAIGYTASGEMKSHPQYGQMVWDVEGRMRGAGGGVYGYDGDGVRVKKTVGGVTTYYVGDGMGNVGAEYGGAGVETGTRYLVGDHLGSVRVVVDGAGVVKARCDYAPFGEKIDGTGAFGNRDLIGEYACGDAGAGGRFTGKERDGETGLDYFGARYYSGGMGRFASADAPFAVNVRNLSGGRSAYWDDTRGMVVIHDPSTPDKGTAFIPDRGRAYFDSLR